MDLTYKQEVGVGGLVLAGLTVFLVGMFWLTGRTFSSKGIVVHAVFDNVAGLKEGDPVMVSGVKKGRVARVVLDRAGHVTVTLEVAADVAPQTDAGATVASGDFFGGRYINYFPGSTGQDLPSNSTIQGTREAQLTDVAEGVAGKADTLLTNATALINDHLAADIHNTLVATQRGMDVIAKAGSGPLVAQTTATLAAVERVMTHLDSLIQGGTGKRIDTLTTNISRLTDQLAQATTSLNSLMTQINSGKGTLGKMATDSTLYTNLNTTLVSLTALLNDLKERPGRYLTVKVF